MYVTRAHTLVTYVSSEQGLGSLYHADEEERRCQEQYSLISKGCMIVHVPRNRFLQLADAETLERVRRDVRHYPSELQLRHQFVANSLWDTYKQVNNKKGILHGTCTFAQPGHCNLYKIHEQFMELSKISHHFRIPGKWASTPGCSF